VAHNPAWTDDELILAIELIDRRGWLGGNARTLEYLELSTLLRNANFPNHEGIDEKFRSVNSVSLKIGNLIGANDRRPGGLRTTERERDFVDQFLADPDRIRTRARELRRQIGAGEWRSSD